MNYKKFQAFNDNISNNPVYQHGIAVYTDHVMLLAIDYYISQMESFPDAETIIKKIKIRNANDKF